MKKTIRILSTIAVVVSVFWFYNDATYESLLAIVVSIIAMFSTYVSWGGKQEQAVSKNSSGIQAGQDVIVNNVECNKRKSSNK